MHKQAELGRARQNQAEPSKTTQNHVVADSEHILIADFDQSPKKKQKTIIAHAEV